jgi:nicotinamidase-related amidase
MDSPDQLVVVAAAKPFPFSAPRGRLGLLNIDWQRDFLEPGGFGDSLGNNIALLQAALGPTAALLAAARAAGMPVFHTLEAHKLDLSNLPPSKKKRCSAIGEVLEESRGKVLIEGEPGNAIVDEVAPIPGEIIINKPGKGAFWNTSFEAELQRLGVTHLLVTGVTTEVCVQTTIREANDRGYECLLVTDATESYFPEFKASTLDMIVAQGGIAGWTAFTHEIIPALEAAGSLEPVEGAQSKTLPVQAIPELPPKFIAVDPESADGITVTAAKPFPFSAPRGRLGLLNIDWQRDFLEPGGFGDSLGNNIALLQAALGPTAALLAAARAAGMPVFHTLEAHKPDLSNLPPSKKKRCSAIGEVLDELRGKVLIEGEPGNAIVDEVAPIAGEIIINKPGKGAFWNTSFEAELQRLGVTHLLVTGVTTEVCVQTTIREANDRGYECLLVTDATESYFPEFKASTLDMIVAQGGIAGWTASTDEIIPAIQASGSAAPVEASAP